MGAEQAERLAQIALNSECVSIETEGARQVLHEGGWLLLGRVVFQPCLPESRQLLCRAELYIILGEKDTIRLHERGK